MAQLTPNNRHHSESTWSICYDSAYNNRVFDQWQNTASFPGCMELGQLPLFMKLWWAICKKRKSLMVYEKTYVYKKTAFDLDHIESRWASNNVLTHLQRWFGRHLLEIIWNIGPVPTYPWHQLDQVSPTIWDKTLLLCTPNKKTAHEALLVPGNWTNLARTATLKIVYLHRNLFSGSSLSCITNKP